MLGAAPMSYVPRPAHTPTLQPEKPARARGRRAGQARRTCDGSWWGGGRGEDAAGMGLPNGEVGIGRLRGYLARPPAKTGRRSPRARTPRPRVGQDHGRLPSAAAKSLLQCRAAARRPASVPCHPRRPSSARPANGPPPCRGTPCRRPWPRTLARPVDARRVLRHARSQSSPTYGFVGSSARADSCLADGVGLSTRPASGSRAIKVYMPPLCGVAEGLALPGIALIRSGLTFLLYTLFLSSRPDMTSTSTMSSKTSHARLDSGPM